jgi:hypothetical protein
MVVAMVALVAAFGGSAIAGTAVDIARKAKLINGKNIKSRSIAGSKLKRNTLTGTEINESKLAVVPDANKANSATTATSATSASTATSATSATSASSADKLDGLDSTAFVTQADRMDVAWIVVAADGTVLRQSGGFAVIKTNTGAYTVDNPDLDESAVGYGGSTFHEPGGGSAPGFVATFANNANGFQVRTYNSSGAAADSGFSLVAPFVNASGSKVG